MDLSEILRVFRASHKLPVIKFWGVIRQECWIPDHFEIFVTTALKRAQGNRWQSEDGDATWRIALPWRRYLRATTAI